MSVHVAVFVDEHAVVDRQPGLLGELRTWLDSEPGDDDVGIDRTSVSGHDAKAGVSGVADLRDLLPRQDVDALRAVVVVHVQREV